MKQRKRSHKAKLYEAEPDSTCIASMQYQQGVLTIEYVKGGQSYDYDASLADYRAILKDGGAALNERILGR
jgi:hypothetical protein